MNSLVKLLNDNTEKKGLWSIECNGNRAVYESPQEFYSREILDGIDIGKDIYFLRWYKDTPVGFYSKCFNDLESMEKYVLEIIVEDKK